MNEAAMDDEQHVSRIHVEWGVPGAQTLSTRSALVVVVDVLSFSTTVSVAADRGTAVMPFPFDDDRARIFAARHDAVLAVARQDARPGEMSLSAAATAVADPVGTVVLPSPNGATISHLLATRGVECVVGCPRNAGALGAWAARRFDPRRANVGVVAAGERWPVGSLRPAVEDLWGAGAVVEALRGAGWDEPTPEAATAQAAWESVSDDLLGALLACVSGQELVAQGYAGDVAIAADVGAGRSVPHLVDGAFRPELQH